MATSDQVLTRIRNRIIEHLELASSSADQIEYQRTCPANVADEIFNQWGDWVAPGWREDFVPGAIFTGEEVAAIADFDSLLLELAPELPDLDLATAMLTPQWTRLLSGASHALGVFQQRGPLPES